MNNLNKTYLGIKRLGDLDKRPDFFKVDQNTKNKYLRFIEKWHKIIGIEDQDIIIDIRDTKMAHETHIHGFVGYNPFEDRWIIFLPKEPGEYVMIHELGHIAFNVKFGVNDYADKSKLMTKETMPEEPISYIHRAIDDCFANYNLTLNPRVYHFIRKKFLKTPIITAEVIYKNGVYLHLHQYILHYLHWNYVLKAKDTKEYLKVIENSLNELKNCVFLKAKNENIELGFNYFERLNKQLDTFNTIKKPKDFQTVIEFTIKVMLACKIWSREEVFNWTRDTHRVKK